jgi:hypothetical protein
MKLTPAQIEQTVEQLDVKAVPDYSKLVPEFEHHFGKHTFFLAETGLHIVQPIASEQDEGSVARVVRLATWTDSSHNQLAVQEPQFTDILLQLDRAA